MPTVSPIEKELVSATKTKMKGDRQTALKNLVDAASDLEEEKWEELSAKAQAWVNAGIKASNSEKDIKDFAKAKDEDDDGDDAVKEEEEEEDGDVADEAPEDEPDEPAPRKKKARPPVDEDDEPETSEDTEKDDDMSEDEDEAPKKKVAAKKAAKKAAVKKAPPKKETKKTVAAKEVPEKKAKPGRAVTNGSVLDKKGIKYRVKMAMMKKPNIGVDELCEKIGEGTPMTVSQIRAEFRHSLRFLKQEGHLETAIE